MNATNELTRLPDSSTIPVEYVVELVNGLAHLADDMADRTIDGMKTKLLQKLKK